VIVPFFEPAEIP